MYMAVLLACSNLRIEFGSKLKGLFRSSRVKYNHVFEGLDLDFD